MKKVIFISILALLLSACGTQGTGPIGMGDSAMMSRHSAEIPTEYAGLTNPIPSNESSLERGKELYAMNCASCHGDGGMGDGPAGSALDPAPAPVAHTSQMLADDYLFWRISEGGTPFNTSMPPWKFLDEQARWDMINYMRALGEGTVQPSARQTEMLAQAVDQGAITQAEADTFSIVHNAVEQYLAEHPEVLNSGGKATEREAATLAALVKEEIITQAEADAFTEIHDRLATSGLMP